MVKIGAELPKLSQNKSGYPFFGPPCILPFINSLMTDVLLLFVDEHAFDYSLVQSFIVIIFKTTGWAN